MNGCGSGYIRIDETPVQVLKSDRPARRSTGCGCGSPVHPRQRIILFDYDPSRGTEAAASAPRRRARDHPERWLYAYDQVAKQSGLMHCGCIAHARRKFFDAIKALPKEEQQDSTAAHEAVRRIDELYTIEREIGAMTDAERVAVRARKIVAALRIAPRLGDGTAEQHPGIGQTR